MSNQITLVLIKPDGVERQLVGEFITRLERTGLTMSQMRMLRPTQDQVAQHFTGSSDWLRSMGKKTLEFCAEHGVGVDHIFNTDDPIVVGEQIKDWGCAYFHSGRIVAMGWEGPDAIAAVRKLIGNTIPLLANPGTIRGDYSTDSPVIAVLQRRSLYNLVHASGNSEEAEREIQIWVGKQ